jgi:adenylate cyclase, class 2
MASHLNVEIKARHADPDGVRRYLVTAGAVFAGIDRQVDTYFNCGHGRLKLRQGNIENALIHYARPNEAGPKSSEVNMMQVSNGVELKSLLTTALGVQVVVDKYREIYFIGNVKFHVDRVQGLGHFVEIEAIDKDGSLGREKLLQQCQFYMQALGIEVADCLTHSYSDMLGENKNLD